MKTNLRKTIAINTLTVLMTVLYLAVLMAYGCSKQQSGDQPQGATSSLNMPDAYWLGERVAELADREQLFPNPRVSRVNDTRSMVPSIGASTVLISEPATVRQIRTDDVVVFVSPLDGVTTIAHRVIRTGDGWIQTKGDAAARPDPFTVTDRELIGRVVVQVNARREE